MNNWNGEEFIDNFEAEQFFDKLQELCEEFDVSISHEDKYGAFVLEHGFSEANMKWMRAATLPNWSGIKHKTISQQRREELQK